MTKEEILAMKAGRELNIRVVEDVMGGKFIEDEIFGDTEKRALDLLYGVGAHCLEAPFFGPLRRYSENMSAAQDVIDRLKKWTDLPMLVLEGDIVDASAFDEAQTKSQIDAFIDAVAAHKAKKAR